MEFSKRYLALGDSFTEGVGDADPNRPNEVRGWADRVAEELCLDPDWGYANLAIRGKKIRQVIDEQLPLALELRPTLVSLYAGGNDILRPSVDIDSLMNDYDQAVAALRATGAQVLLFTGFDTNGAALFERSRGRTAIYNEAVREIAEAHGAVIADYWRWRDFSDVRYWAADRLHMGAPGHQLMARKVLGVLEAETSIEIPELPALERVRRLEKLKDDARWTREFLAPWVKRRLTGTSSGDALRPKYPEFTSLTG